MNEDREKQKADRITKLIGYSLLMFVLLSYILWIVTTYMKRRGML